MDYKLSQVSGKQTSLFTVIKMASIAIYKDNSSFVWSGMRLDPHHSQPVEITPFMYFKPLPCRVYWNGVCAMFYISFMQDINFQDMLDNLVFYELILYLYSITYTLGQTINATIIRPSMIVLTMLLYSCKDRQFVLTGSTYLEVRLRPFSIQLDRVLLFFARAPVLLLM